MEFIRKQKGRMEFFENQGTRFVFPIPTILEMIHVEETGESLLPYDEPLFTREEITALSKN